MSYYNARVFFGAKNPSATNPWGDGPDGSFFTIVRLLDHELYGTGVEILERVKSRARRQFRAEMPEQSNLIRWVEVECRYGER